jgi:hypothetical protein
MSTVTLQEAQASLPEIIDRLLPGEEVTIVEKGQPIAQVKKSDQVAQPCVAGCYKKSEFWMSPDFDAPLEDFKEYME